MIMIKLMYITNRPIIAQIAECAGVDRVFIDLEYIGKAERQGGMDTVQSRHTLDDIKKVAYSITQAELLVRINPIHDSLPNYPGSKEEIDIAIRNGAKILMLPYFKTIAEVKTFLRLVNGRSKTMLLLETPEAVNIVDDILSEGGFDEIYIGLNDLSLGYGMKFMFELLSNGLVERLCYKFREHNIPFGFGGIAALGKGELLAEYVIAEHYSLGSTRAILSRSFCNVDKISHMGIISSTFVNGVRAIREYEKSVMIHSDFFINNHKKIKEIVLRICRDNV